MIRFRRIHWLFLGILLSALASCKTYTPTKEMRCVLEPAIATELRSDNISKIADSLAQVTIHFENHHESQADYVLARMINTQSDSSSFKEVYDGKSISFELDPSLYRLEIRGDLGENFIVENLDLNAYEKRILTIYLGRPSQFVTYETLVKKRRTKKSEQQPL